MRQKRTKMYRKLMALYSTAFGFRQPYQVLVDSNMCKSAIDLKLELVKQLGTVLQGDIKPMITQCCIHELYVQGITQQPTVDLAKKFERRKCNHREPIPGDECVASVVGDANKHRYVIATQSQPLRSKLRNIPAVPIVHINRAVMVLEPPSNLTLEVKKSAEETFRLAEPDLTLVASSNTPELIWEKRKGPKAPNPLSIKKKTVSKNEGNKEARLLETATMGKKRKRHTSDDESEGQADISGATPVKKRRRRRKTASASNRDPA